MSMHLEGPWLSTTGKRKVKQKFRSAEQAKQHRQQEKEWVDLKKKWGAEELERKSKKGLGRPLYQAPKLDFRGSDMLNKPSLGSGVGVAVKQDAMAYTGSLIKGVSQMHKSNSVPVIDNTQIEEISKMRRG